MTAAKINWLLKLPIKNKVPSKTAVSISVAEINMFLNFLDIENKEMVKTIASMITAGTRKKAAPNITTLTRMMDPASSLKNCGMKLLFLICCS